MAEAAIFQDTGMESLESMVLSDKLPHVLEKVLGYLSVKEQKGVRFVCKSWNSAAIVQLRKSHPRAIFSFPHHGLRKQINLFKDNFRIDRRSPYARFLLWTEVDMSQQQWNLYNNVLKAISKQATDLTVRYDIMRKSTTREIKNTPALNFLHTLNLDVTYQTSPGDMLEGYMDPLLQLIEKAPNLQRLILKVRAFPTYDNVVVNMLHLLLNSLKKKTNLDHLTLQSPGYEDAHFVRIATMGLELKSFTLKGQYFDPLAAAAAAALDNIDNYDDVDDAAAAADDELVPQPPRDPSIGQGLVEFLKSQSNSLQKLTISWFQRIFEHVDFPTMTRLKFLQVHGWKMELPGAPPIPQIDYCKQLPALQSVLFTEVIQDAHTFDWVTFLPSPGSLPSTSITALEIPFTRPFIPHEYDAHLLNALQHFPNLKIVSIPASRNILDIIMICLPNLEELVLKVNNTDSSIDHLLTGLDAQQLGMLQYMNKLEDFNTPHQPLSAMKSLKKLRLINFPGVFGPEITMLSVNHVLNQMPLLREIDFGFRSMIPELEKVIAKLHAQGKDVFCIDVIQKPQRADYDDTSK